MSGILFHFVWGNLNDKCYTTTDTSWFGIVYSGLSKPCFRYICLLHFFLSLYGIVNSRAMAWYDKATDVFVCQWCVSRLLWFSKMNDKCMWRYTSCKRERTNTNIDQRKSLEAFGNIMCTNGTWKRWCNILN